APGHAFLGKTGEATTILTPGEGLASGAINTAVNGGSLGDNLVSGLVSQAGNVAAALGKV
ncbi:hypothetical protein PSA5_20450, partial [Pseudomonas syringae pv. actinidiae]